MSYKNFITKYKVKIAICHWTFARPTTCLSDNNEVWLDRLSDQSVRSKNKDDKKLIIVSEVCLLLSDNAP